MIEAVILNRILDHDWTNRRGPLRIQFQFQFQKWPHLLHLNEGVAYICVYTLTYVYIYIHIYRGHVCVYVCIYIYRCAVAECAVQERLLVYFSSILNVCPHLQCSSPYSKINAGTLVQSLTTRFSSHIHWGQHLFFFLIFVFVEVI